MPPELRLISLRLASDLLSKYIFLTVGRVGSSTDLIVQRVEFVQDSDKRNYLMDLLPAQKDIGVNGKAALTLVFVETKKGADSLEYLLCTQDFPATTIHGDRTHQVTGKGTSTDILQKRTNANPSGHRRCGAWSGYPTRGSRSELSTFQTI